MRQQSPSAQSLEAPFRMQAIRQIQDEIREQVRVEAWAAMRAKLRVVVAGLVLVSLSVGVLIGYFGIERPTSERTQRASGPIWECMVSNPDIDPAMLPPQPTPWPIRVYISGAVNEPRVLALPPGSLVADAVHAVGGASADADLAGLNLAAPLRDHQHIQVPRLSEQTRPATPLPASWPELGHSPISNQLVDINTATVDELEALPGIGATRAREIVAYRVTYGPFGAPEDIMKVPGIGPATYERLASLITVDAHITEGP